MRSRDEGGARRSSWWRSAIVSGAVLALGVSDASAQPTCRDTGPIAPERLEQSGCQLDSIGLVPLTDLGCRTYLGLAGGLYPGGSNTMPIEHRRAGVAASSAVVARGPDGRPSAAAGKIGFASIGMSNTEMEFGWFDSVASATPDLNPAVVRVNGAQGTRTAEQWADPDSLVWDVFDQRVAEAGLTPMQIQVVWVKLAEGRPASLGAFPRHAQRLQAHLVFTLRNAKARYPNLALAYLSSRTRAYTTVADSLNPEPYAYESGFAVQTVVAQQIAGNPLLRHQGADALVPWVAWGPYLWADGTKPRSDGFTWECSDTSDDFVHPWFSGQQKVAEQLLAFLQTEPTAQRWFLAPERSACGLLGIEPVAALLLARRGRRSR